MAGSSESGEDQGNTHSRRAGGEARGGAGGSIGIGMTRVAGTLHILARALQLLIEIVSLR